MISAAASQKRQTEIEVVKFCEMVNGLVENLSSNRYVDSGENFNFVGEVLKEYFCPVCLDKPVETDCKHCFCSDCIKEVVTTSGNLSCSMGKDDFLNSMRALMVINFIKDLSVTCGQDTRYEDCSDHVCINLNERARLHVQLRPTAAAVQQPEPAPKPVQELEQEVREGRLTPQAERLAALFVKAKLGS